MRYAYVGCRTTKERNARVRGLKTYRIEENGEWTELQCLRTEDNPSYQTLDHKKEFLYSVHGDLTKLSSFRIQQDGTLKTLNTVEIDGKNPVFITVDKSNQYLVVATLQGGSVVVLKRNADGSIGAVTDRVKFAGKTKYSNSFIHQCIWDQKKEYLFVPAQGRIVGIGQLRVFRFHSENGTLEQTDAFTAREFAEPRHVAVHPNNRYVYLINEKGNYIMFFEFDENTGKLSPRQILPTLPETYTGNGQASAVLTDDTGEFLIGSNRIHDSLAVYRINKRTGYLINIGFVPSLGRTPRFMTFDPEQKTHLYVANEDSDTIVEMQVNAEFATVQPTGRIIRTESPVCITFR